jgi:lysophospholipase L1-like esterase
MEKTIIGILVVIIAFIMFYYVPKQKKSAVNNVFKLFLDGAYSARMEWFATANKYIKPGTSVFVGDSLTQEFMITEVFHNKNVVNRGIGGDTTLGVLNRLHESILDIKPKQVFLLIGTNDLELTTLTPKQISENIEKIYQDTISINPSIQFIFVSVPPIGSKSNHTTDTNTTGKRTLEQIQELNGYIKNIASEYNQQYIDLYQLVADSNGYFIEEFTREGLHFTPKGYEHIEQLYKKFL